MIKKLTALSGALLLVAGCGNLAVTEQKVNKAFDTASAMRDLAERNAGSGAGTRTSRPRFAGDEVVLRTSSWPAAFEQQDSYVTKGSQTLLQVLDDLAATRGIAIKTAELAQQASPVAAGPSMLAPNGAAPTGFGGSNTANNISIEYTGTRRGLLEALASKADVSVRYNASTNTVEFFRYETRTLSVSLPAGSKTIAASISLAGVTGGGSSAAGGGAAGGAGGGGGAATAGNVSVSQDLTVNPWASIMDGIGTILSQGQSDTNKAGSGQQQKGGNGGSTSLAAVGSQGSAIANPELGLITVTARPPALERVARYVESINTRYAQNVLIDVKIYSVSLDEQTSLGFNMNMLYSQIGRLGASVVGPGPLTAGTNNPGVLTLTSKNPNSPWNGSTLVAQALSQFGKVSLQRQGQVLAVNGQPSPIQVANEITYPASSTINTVPNSGVTKAKTQAQKVIGFTANFLPLILGDNRILLSYQLQLSTLASPLTPDADGVVSPNIASQSLQQQAFVRDGQAIVLFGYDEQRDSFDYALHPAGVSRAASNARSMVVIVMQINAGVKDGSI